jgi:aspartyl aminopeptidase
MFGSIVHTQGASSPLMFDAMKRASECASGQGAEHAYYRMLRKSFLVSADMAHCLHPNYMDRHEESHQPKMHKGLVIKHNANQR